MSTCKTAKKENDYSRTSVFYSHSLGKYQPSWEPSELMTLTKTC